MYSLKRKRWLLLCNFISIFCLFSSTILTLALPIQRGLLDPIESRTDKVSPFRAKQNPPKFDRSSNVAPNGYKYLKYLYGLLTRHSNKTNTAIITTQEDILGNLKISENKPVDSTERTKISYDFDKISSIHLDTITTYRPSTETSKEQDWLKVQLEKIRGRIFKNLVDQITPNTTKINSASSLIETNRVIYWLLLILIIVICVAFLQMCRMELGRKHVSSAILNKKNKHMDVTIPPESETTTLLAYKSSKKNILRSLLHLFYPMATDHRS